MRKTFEVVDSFYANPEAVRSHALEEDGRRYVDTQAVSRIRELLGTTEDRLLVQPDAGRFVVRGRDVPDDDEPRQDEADWVAVTFLSAAEPPDSGLSFWRVSNASEGAEHRLRTAFIPLRHNRMILYRPAALRPQATAGFGSGPADAWLHHELRFDVRRGREGEARAE